MIKKVVDKKNKKQAGPETYDVIEYPVITEKSQQSADALNKFIFYVSSFANKVSIKKAVEALFSVDVLKVNIINEKGKVKRHRGRTGRLKDQKKAIVTVAQGQTIDTGTSL